MAGTDVILGPFTITGRDLIGAAVVVVLAVAGPLVDRPTGNLTGTFAATTSSAGEAARLGHSALGVTFGGIDGPTT